MARITVPYAVADFEDLRERGFYYVDKTDYIPGLEDYNAPVFLRPRRFGKSLLISMLASYYARTKVNRSVLATGILDFRADLTKVESDNIVRFQLSTENGKKEIETLHSVSLRNKVKVKKPADSGWR